MAEQTFYVEDTVALRNDKTSIGQVDRTYGDVSSHIPYPGAGYAAGIKKSRHISKQAFKDFVRTGVPPRGAVLVTWLYTKRRTTSEYLSLLLQTELTLVDRSLIVGDVVKRNAHETMSGTVVQTSTTATLLKPKRWPQAHSDTLDGSALESCRIGNYSLEDVLHGVNTDDLVPSSRYNLDQFVLYKSWIGRIVSKWEDFYVRLSNNSVVVPEDPEDLDVSSFGDPSGDLPAVGDFVETRKSNLRRGRWVYGAYNANIEPYGYIADIRTTSLEVDWLTFKLGGVTSPDADVPPPVTVDQDILESGELVVYDRRKRARVADEMKRLDLDTFMGDAVRFRDPAGAAVKYNAFDRIPRTDTLGFDVNTMKVVKCNTLVTVLWQDLTTSSIPSTQLIPYLDIASDEEIWPGELIGARKSNTSAGSGGKFDKYGVAQSINARDRIARVRWFTNPSALFLDDEAEIMDPEAVTGPLGEEVEEVSLYDVQTLPGMSMRLGDLVALRPSHNQAPRNGYKSQIHEQVEGLLNASDTIDWFGEVIELGLDGLLTIRLAASSNVRDIRVPWEFTFRVYSTDYDDPEVDDDDMDEEMSDEDYTDEDTDEDMPEVVEVQGEDGQWRDLVDVGDEDLEDWMTDEEHGEAAPDDADEQPPEVNGVVSQDNDEGMTDALEPVPENVLAVLPIPQQQQSVAAVSPSAFSYKSMFEGEGKLPAPEQFAILETSPPADHHFSSRTPVTNAVRTKRIQREYRILQDSLPEGIYVRTWESALDLIRVLILGPLDTPYGYAPFVIDLYLDHNYPHQPPQAFFHSWTHGTGPINPNLYEDGKICLSLLGTWPGDERNETWNPLNSTILQLVVSLVGLVFVKEPFYNEAGYEARAGTAEARIPSAIYSERTYFNSLGFIIHALRNRVKGFEEEIKTLYLHETGPMLAQRAVQDAVAVMVRSNATPAIYEESPVQDAPRRVSVGAVIPLKRQIEALQGMLHGHYGDDADEFEPEFVY